MSVEMLSPALPVLRRQRGIRCCLYVLPLTRTSDHVIYLTPSTALQGLVETRLMVDIAWHTRPRHDTHQPVLAASSECVMVYLVMILSTTPQLISPTYITTSPCLSVSMPCAENDLTNRAASAAAAAQLNNSGAQPAAGLRATYTTKRGYRDAFTHS